jgi:hypothetical protein
MQEKNHWCPAGIICEATLIFSDFMISKTLALERVGRLTNVNWSKTLWYSNNKNVTATPFPSMRMIAPKLWDIILLYRSASFASIAGNLIGTIDFEQ